ncbi:MAG: hypothetical protein KDJ86_09920 [Bauldia sp.]|uniref:hypothetical protein n=1 Tax=Bauldia sp. TaxID=2575872 RepID=UPI001DB4C290|nr:hypothetical protein [Bauldia sp.]MCB1496090.1 hypothetical protein [Bauldia sp.]
MGYMRLSRSLLAVVALGLLATVAVAGATQLVPTPVPRPARAAPSTPAPASVQVSHGSVYFLRGLLNVFSRGMDRLSDKLEARGIQSRVTNYTHWQEFATLLVNQYRTDKSLTPVIIVGHSLGADAAINMGNYLGRNGVPVRLVVSFDAVDGGSAVGAGIDEVVNYYKSDGVGRVIKASPSFKGELVNVDVADRTDIDHLNIEKDETLHEEVIVKVVDIFNRQ